MEGLLTVLRGRLLDRCGVVSGSPVMQVLKVRDNLEQLLT